MMCKIKAQLLEKKTDSAFPDWNNKSTFIVTIII